MKVYLSGPVSLGGTLSADAVSANVERFRRVAVRLSSGGHEVLDPTRIDGGAEWTWADWMRAALAMLLQADRVHLLPGWERSPGARVEVGLAHHLAIEITTEGQATEPAP